MLCFYFILLILPMTNAWTHAIQKKAPVVFAGECETLKKSITRSSIGKELLYICDPIYEPQCTPDNIRDNLRSFLQNSLVLKYYTGLPICQVDTSKMKVVNQLNIENEHNNMVQSLNMVRAFLQGGYSDMYNMKLWNITFDPIYNNVMNNIQKCLVFNRNNEYIANYFIGHPMFCPSYENIMIRKDSITEKYYSCSSHIIWIHKLEYYTKELIRFATIVENPIGIYIYGDTDMIRLTKLIKKINPSNEMGKVLLITRTSSHHLSKIIPYIKKQSLHVCWCADLRGFNKNTIRDIINIHQQFDSFTGIRINATISLSLAIGEYINSLL